MSFDQTIFKNCLAQFGNNPPRDGKGLSGPMNGLEVVFFYLINRDDYEIEFFSVQCVFECILNQTKTIENDKPNAQMLIQKITGALSTDPDWIPVTTAGINYCVLQLNSNAPKIKASLKGDQPNGKTVCSGNSAFFLSCLFTYEFRNCPIKKWTNDTKCNELKGYFNQCPTPQIN